MDWVDFILDNINKFGVKNITFLEKSYLDNLNNDVDEYLIQLNMRYELYERLYTHEPTNNWTGDLWIIEPNEEEKIETSLYLLWSNMEEEDATNFMNIYNIPGMYLNFDYYNLKKPIKEKFHRYWKEYYGFTRL